MFGPIDENEQEKDSQKNTQKSSEETSNYLLNKLKTKEMKVDKKKDEAESKDKQIEVKGAGGDTDFANILEKVAYGLLIVGGVALVGLIICSLLSMIWFTPIPAAVFTAFGATAAVGIFAGGVSYISKFFVDIGQTFARTKFKGSSSSKSKEPEIKKGKPKMAVQKPPNQAQDKTQNKKPTQNNQHALKIRSDKTKSVPQRI